MEISQYKIKNWKRDKKEYFYKWSKMQVVNYYKAKT